jgi:hypothetical protein
VHAPRPVPLGLRENDLPECHGLILLDHHTNIQ